MTRWPHILGALLGIIAALAVLEARSRRHGSSRDSAMMPECGGAIREIVIHYVAGDTIASPVYEQFLPQLPEDVIVHVVCPDRAAFDELQARVERKLCPTITGHAMTVWSRDRWAAVRSDQSTTLVAPAAEDGAETWPARAGDARVAFDLALAHGVSVKRLDLHFDAGDLLADDAGNVWVTPAVVDRNLQRTVETREQLIGRLSEALGRHVILLNDKAPDHHAGMFMMAVGDQTMLVGDPSLAASLNEESTLPTIPGGADLARQTQERFDSVAE